MNLILIEAREVDDGGHVCLRDERARHLLRVLRVIPDQVIRVGLVDGPLGAARVEHVTSDEVMLRCEFQDTPPRPPVDLLLALPRPKVLRRLWAQLAALGVGHVMLTNAERVERNYFDTHLLQQEVYRPLLIEGLQQARDTHLPRVTIHRQFRVLVEDHLDLLTTDSLRLVAEPGETRTIARAVAAASNPRVLLAVGPEGGWNTFELNLLQQHAFMAVGMGARTLRADTACVALLALVHDALHHR